MRCVSVKFTKQLRVLQQELGACDNKKGNMNKFDKGSESDPRSGSISPC